MDNHPENWVSNLEVSINGGKKIGVPEVLDAKDMANPNVEYLGVMAWVAQFQWIPDKTAPGDRLEMRCNLNKIKVGEEVSFNFFFPQNWVFSTISFLLFANEYFLEALHFMLLFNVPLNG